MQPSLWPSQCGHAGERSGEVRARNRRSDNALDCVNIWLDFYGRPGSSVLRPAGAEGDSVRVCPCGGGPEGDRAPGFERDPVGGLGRKRRRGSSRTGARRSETGAAGPAGGMVGSRQLRRAAFFNKTSQRAAGLGTTGVPRCQSRVRESGWSLPGTAGSSPEGRWEAGDAGRNIR